MFTGFVVKYYCEMLKGREPMRVKTHVTSRDSISKFPAIFLPLGIKNPDVVSQLVNPDVAVERLTGLVLNFVAVIVANKASFYRLFVKLNEYYGTLLIIVQSNSGAFVQTVPIMPLSHLTNYACEHVDSAV
jgi:hypothetical protein